MGILIAAKWMRTLAIIGGRGIYQITPNPPLRKLALVPPAWHGARMEQQSGRASRAGGAIIAFSIMIGALVGAKLGQPSAGVVIGTTIGVAIAAVLYIYDSRKG